MQNNGFIRADARFNHCIKMAKDYIASHEELAGVCPLSLANAFYGLDFSRYEVMRVISNAGDLTIIQKSTDEQNTHYCLQYRGSGRYFDTWEELSDYYTKRFKDNPLQKVSR